MWGVLVKEVLQGLQEVQVRAANCTSQCRRASYTNHSLTADLAFPESVRSRRARPRPARARPAREACPEEKLLEQTIETVETLETAGQESLRSQAALEGQLRDKESLRNGTSRLRLIWCECKKNFNLRSTPGPILRESTDRLCNCGAIVVKSWAVFFSWLPLCFIQGKGE